MKMLQPEGASRVQDASKCDYIACNRAVFLCVAPVDIALHDA